MVAYGTPNALIEVRFLVGLPNNECCYDMIRLNKYIHDNVIKHRLMIDLKRWDRFFGGISPSTF